MSLISDIVSRLAIGKRKMTSKPFHLFLLVLIPFNRKAEFSLGLLLETGVIEDTFDAKEYYTRSANKGYAPAQIQLALILLRENSPEGVSWLRSAARLVK
jgi:TPR repeat protein